MNVSVQDSGDFLCYAIETFAVSADDGGSHPLIDCTPGGHQFLYAVTKSLHVRWGFPVPAEHGTGCPVFSEIADKGVRPGLEVDAESLFPDKLSERTMFSPSDADSMPFRASFSISLKAASPFSENISGMDLPAILSMQLSRSSNLQESMEESIFPTLLFPHPMKPHNDIIMMNVFQNSVGSSSSWSPPLSSGISGSGSSSSGLCRGSMKRISFMSYWLAFFPLA